MRAFETPFDHDFAAYQHAVVEETTTRDGVVLFWGGRLSQWYLCRFEHNGITYNCAEQYMMAEKAKLFGDRVTYEKILCSPYPKAQKELGRQVIGFDAARWAQCAVEIVRRGNTEKFAQNPGLKKHLLETAPHRIAEASPNDTIWGIGLAADHPDASNPERWLGTNLLGQVLVDVRNLFKRRRRW